MSEASREEAIFLTAKEIPDGPGRDDYLRRACDGDAELRARVEELLRSGDAAAEPLDDETTGPPTQFLDAVGEDSGDQIGPYKIREQIGEGGFGIVYVAVQEKPVRRKVALKVIKPGMDTKDVIARFEAEQQALALMDHPNVAKVLDAGSTETGRPYFVMELVHGVRITEFCDKNRLAMKDRLRLFLDVCRAVQHAHHKGIIHRDLKPNNILVTLHDGRPVPKVIDFGVAKALSQPLTDKSIYTAYGQMIGTPEYMSPEQAEMSGLGIDTRSDIYSLGVLLYELLVGQPPFEAKRLRASGFEGILRIIREEEPPQPSTKVSTMGRHATVVAEHRRTDVAKLRQTLRGELDWIVMKALEKDRNRRYETANGFANDVERYLNDEAVEACPPSKIYKLRKFARRNKGPVAAAAALLVMLFLGLAGTTAGLVRANAAAADAKRAEARATLERNSAVEQRRRADRALASADQARRAERRTNFHMAFDRGIALCEEGQVGSGMLWLARALELAPDTETDMRRVIRANLSAWRRELHTLEAIFPHSGCVSTVNYGPQGNLVFTGTTDGQIKIWDREDQTLKLSPQPHQGQVHEFDFSPDGQYFLTASYDNDARLWSMSTAELIHTFEHNDTVYGALFTADGRIVTSTAGGEILLWESRERPWTKQTQWDGTALPPRQHAVHDISLSPDGSQIVAACHDGNVVVWDLEQRQPVARFTGHLGSRVATADFLGANRIASGDTDGNVYLWTWADMDATAEGKRFGRPYRHQGGVHRLRVSDDGDRILTASFDNHAQLLDAETGDPIGVPFEHQGALHAAALARDGSLLTGCGDNNAFQWRSATRSLQHLIQHDESTQPAIYSPDGEYVIIRGADGIATVHGARTNERIGEPIQTSEGIYGLSVSDDESIVATGGARGTVQFWTAASGQALGEPFKHAVAAWGGVLFGPHGEWAYSAALDGVVKRWNARTGMALERPLLRLGGNSIRGLALSPDGSRLALATSTKEALIIETATGKTLQRMTGHQDMVMAAAFSTDGQLLVTGSFDNTARVYDAETGQNVSGPMRHRGPIWYSVAFNSKGTAVVTACEDRTVRVWDVATGEPIGPRLPHDATLCAVAFTDDDSQLITGTATGKTRIWDVSSEPMHGDVEHIKLWLQVSSGMELVPETGGVRILDPAAWQARRHALESRGGPPST